MSMIKVMSFNIRYGPAADGENQWDRRKSSRPAEDSVTLRPDLLGLQECRDDAQADFVKSNLPDFHFYGVHREGEGGTALEMAPASSSGNPPSASSGRASSGSATPRRSPAAEAGAASFRAL